VPVDLHTVPDFQRRVLEAARHIPFGEGRPYAWIATRIGHGRAVRAVGTALGRNPVPLILPCHRVWRSDGGLGGYIFGARVKNRLAALERTTPVLEGCTSTRIVCRVGCIHGRHMRSDHRVVFASVADARSVGYRPCKLCRPAA
jgi:O-6-methylguanine DNA methyltransferase